MSIVSENKVFLLEHFSLERIKAFAAALGDPVTDRRLGVAGIAKDLARKRNLTLATILEDMAVAELRTACGDLAMPADGTVKVLTQRLAKALEEHGAHAIQKAANRAASTRLDVLPARLVRVIDGDTIVVGLEGADVYVRFRGVDAPETSQSDKAEKELDHTSMPRAEMVALGLKTTKWLEKRLAGRKLFLHVQPTPAGPKKHLHHNQHRLLAYLTIDKPDGEDVGSAMLREGYGLVWPRNVVTRRYLHPRSLAYVEACHGSLKSSPGLWREGLEALCPSARDRAWSLEDCKTTCFRKDWREGDGSSAIDD